ncbi:hypothetical protein [Terricaulis silvestris]|uniref:Uncharacterized protein n=1 Tax=Terricaulis silvestris TaxID=2686094 RepID=A0A6I6MVM0_9CAUL|nr:hypothetical protein [Terricaulis silvestris]QGZ96464.1 hypothetical protein DSM104635_03324 [Terricaulis silvestris]
MSEQVSVAPKKPVFLIALFVVLTLLTSAAVGGIAYGLYTGWLTPYWENLSDAHAAVLAQVVFLFGAAWAAVLVPLLFGEQLQNVQDAAKRAEDTCVRIETRMQAAAMESERELKKIVRLQMMSAGHLLDDQLVLLETPEDKNDFVDTRWDKAYIKLRLALSLRDGNAQRSIGNHTRRSPEWWERIKFYDVLGKHHDDFRTLSDKARKAARSLDIGDLRAANAASRAIEVFEPTLPREEELPQPVAAPETAPIFISPSNGAASQQLPQ